MNFIRLPLFTFTILLAVSHAVRAEFLPPQDTLERVHGKVLFSAVVFRHGERYGISELVVNDKSEYTTEFKGGNLTKLGKNQVYRLGQWTRLFYDSLINGKPYSSDTFNMISSDSERVALSAQLFLAGFYPPTCEQTEVWHPKIPWQPIPVYTVQPKDRMITMEEYCARYNLEVDRVKEYPEFLEFLEKHKKTLKHIKDTSKLPIPEADPIETIAEVTWLYDILKGQDLANKKNPDWATEVYPRDLEEFAVMFYKLRTFNREMKRLKGGPLLGHIIDELKNKRDNPQSQKVFQFYAGHNSNIVALLDALYVWDGGLIPFGSALFFELRKLGERYHVTISYRSHEDKPLKLMKIPFCNDPCPLDELIRLTKPVIPIDWDHECEFLEPNYNVMLF